MKHIILFLLITVGALNHSYGQIMEVECQVLRRGGAYLTLTPAHYDEASLPAIGATIYLFLYVNTNLPEGKPEGYYELFTVEVIKYSAEVKSIIVKMNEEMEAAKNKTGLPDILLMKGSRVKISWTL